MLGRRPTCLWYYMWKYVTPLLLLGAITFQLWGMKPIAYGSHTFPPYAARLGWLLTCIPLAPIPLYAAVKLLRFKRSEDGRDMSLASAIHRLTTATDDWGPALSKYRSVVEPEIRLLN